MTKREKYLKALNNEVVDEIVWAPNFDYWLQYNKKANTIPEKHSGKSRNDIVRDIGASLWSRTSGVKAELDSSVKLIVNEYENGDKIKIYKTPIGEVTAKWIKSEDDFSSKFLKEHFIKTIDDIKIMKYVVEATNYIPQYEKAQKSLDKVGDDGVSILDLGCVPAIQFLKTDAGYENGFYMWFDYRRQVDDYISALNKNYVKMAKVQSKSPGDVMATGDNMDATTLPPEMFLNYAKPYYEEVGKIANESGKLLEGHWCGQTDILLPLVPNTKLNIVEAIVTEPMSKMTLNQALDILDGKVVLQGGIPAVYMVEQGASMDEFCNYITNIIKPLKGRKGFILGMSDNVPPDADFKRVEMVAALLK